MQLRLFMDRGPERGYYTKLSKSLFNSDNPEDKAMAKREFKQSGLHLNYIDGRRYLRSYLGPKIGAKGMGSAKVEAWAHGDRTLDKTAKWYPKLAYANLGMLLQIECQYLQSNFPGVGTIMAPLEYSLREAFFPALF